MPFELKTWVCTCGSKEQGTICDVCKTRFRESEHEIIDQI